MRKLRLLAAVIALAAAAAAQGPAKTTVSDTLYDPSGGLATGSITVSAPFEFTSADGYVVYQGGVAAGTITNGALSIALVPNAGSTPSGSYYQVRVRTAFGSYTETWIVPSSGTAVKLSAVRTLLPPTPSYVFAFSQIDPPGGCAANQFIEWSGSNWSCNTSAGGMANPMTTAGDLIVGGTSGTPLRLAATTAGQVLESNGPGVAPSYQDPIVSGPAANGAAPGGSPVLTAGWDGTDVRTISTDASGHPNVNVLGTVPVSGTFWQTTQPVSLTALPALATGSNTIGAVTEAGAPWTTNLLDVGGAGITLGAKLGTSSLPVVLATDQAALPVTGTFWQTTQPVSLASLPALAAGSNNIGHVNVDNFPATQPVSLSGNVSVVGTASDNTANSTAKVPVIPAVATTAAPTYTSGDQVPLSTDTGGNLRVTCANCGGGSGGTAMGDAGSFTQGTTSFTPVGGEYNSSPTSLASGQAGAALMTATRHLIVNVDDFPATQPVSGTVTANAGTGTFTVGGTVTSNIGTTNGLALDATVSALEVAQASTTSGEKGSLLQGAVTTAAPTYTTAQTDPISLTTAGAVRVDGSGVTQPVSGSVSVSNFPATQPVSVASLPALASGSNNIGHVNVDNFPATQPVSGTVTANAGAGFPTAPTASAAVSDSTSGLTQIVAAVAGKAIFVTGYTLLANAAVTAQWEYGTGSNCGTGTTALTGAMSFAANGGAAPGQGNTLFVPAGDALCLNLGGAVQVSGSVSYAQQ